MKKIEIKFPNVSKIIYDATGSLTIVLDKLSQEEYEKAEKIKKEIKKSLIPKKKQL